MTRQEKLTAILERLKAKDVDIDSNHISAMVITGYLDDLSKLGLIESAFALTNTGSTVRAVCNEFDWTPNDDEVKAFVMEMVEPNERAPFMFIVKKWRDDRDGLIEEFKKTKEILQQEPPPSSQLFGG